MGMREGGKGGRRNGKRLYDVGMGSGQMGMRKGGKGVEKEGGTVRRRGDRERVGGNDQRRAMEKGGWKWKEVGGGGGEKGEKAK